MNSPTLTKKPSCWVIPTAVALIVIISSAVAFSIWATIYSKNKHDSSHSHVCPELNGNQDMYGLGIRLGIYLQIIVTAVADVLHMEHTSLELAPATLWFLIAMFVALLKLLRDPSTYAVESYIVISLGNGITWILLGGTIRINPLTLKDTFITSCGRFALWGLWRAVNSVYWLTLRSSPYKQVDEECGPWGWLVVPLKLEGGYNDFQKAWNIISWIPLVFALAPYVLGFFLLLHLLRTMDIQDLLKQRNLSKKMIVFDYMFEAIGELRGIVFESWNKRLNPQDLQVNPQDQGRTPTDEENQVIKAERGITKRQRVGRAIDKVRLKFKRHLYKKYHMKFPFPNNTDVKSSTAQSKPHPEAITNNPGPSTIPNGDAVVEIGSAPTPQINSPPVPARCCTQLAAAGKVLKRELTPSIHFTRLYWARDKFTHRLHKYGLDNFPILPFWNACCILKSVLTIEFTLYLNGIHDVYKIDSAGQLVAFVTGLGGLFMAASNFYVEQRESTLQKRMKSDPDTPAITIDGQPVDGESESTDANGKLGKRGTRYPASKATGPMLSFSQARQNSGVHRYIPGM